MILKTYIRLFTTDPEATLRVLHKLHAGEPHLRFRFDSWELVGIGDVLVVAGTEEALATIRGSLGPWIVADLDGTRRSLVEAGAEITREIAAVPTGHMMYARIRTARWSNMYSGRPNWSNASSTRRSAPASWRLKYNGAQLGPTDPLGYDW